MPHQITFKHRHLPTCANVWYLEDEEEYDGEHVEPHRQPGALISIDVRH